MTAVQPSDPPDRPGSPDDAVRAWVDRSEVAAVLTRYADAVDDRDWDRFESLFEPGAVVDYTGAGGPRADVSEVRRWMEAHLTLEHLPRCQHLLANVSIEVDGDQAQARSAYLNADVLPTAAGSETLVVQGGAYRATFRRTTTWRITSLRADLLWHLDHLAGGSGPPPPRAGT